MNRFLLISISLFIFIIGIGCASAAVLGTSHEDPILQSSHVAGVDSLETQPVVETGVKEYNLTIQGPRDTEPLETPDDDRIIREITCSLESDDGRDLYATCHSGKSHVVSSSPVSITPSYIGAKMQIACHTPGSISIGFGSGGHINIYPDIDLNSSKPNSAPDVPIWGECEPESLPSEVESLPSEPDNNNTLE